MTILRRNETVHLGISRAKCRHHRSFLDLLGCLQSGPWLQSLPLAASDLPLWVLRLRYAEVLTLFRWGVGVWLHTWLLFPCACIFAHRGFSWWFTFRGFWMSALAWSDQSEEMLRAMDITRNITVGTRLSSNKCCTVAVGTSYERRAVCNAVCWYLAFCCTSHNWLPQTLLIQDGR